MIRKNKFPRKKSDWLNRENKFPRKISELLNFSTYDFEMNILLNNHFVLFCPNFFIFMQIFNDFVHFFDKIPSPC